MVDPDSLTRDVFLEELRERVDEMRAAEIDVPADVVSAVETLLAHDQEVFQRNTFRQGAAHLLNGLTLDLFDSDEGALELEERLADLAANLRLTAELAAAEAELV